MQIYAFSLILPNIVPENIAKYLIQETCKRINVINGRKVLVK